MNRLQTELQRLYLPHPSVGEGTVTTQGAAQVRAMSIEVTRPASWEALSKVWRGVQADLGLPAPAIAVSGIDAIQLWFALAEPVGVATAHAFLEALRTRFLPDIDSRRVRLSPASGSAQIAGDGDAWPVPASQESTGYWSAFVAPDLAPVFDDTPWLDIPPGDEGQATLLRGIALTGRVDFEDALTRLGISTQSTASPTSPTSPTAGAMHVDTRMASPQPALSPVERDPKRFLLRVMNDESVSLSLRIDAATALLAHSNDHRALPGD